MFPDTNTLTALAAVGSAFAALGSSILGPVVSYWISRREIRASIVSSNRQLWIDALRNDITELLVHLQLLARSEIADRQSSELVTQGVRLRNRILLRLNPNEEPHRELVRAIDDVLKQGISPESPLTPTAVETASAKIVEISQSILKTEWNRVKSCE